MSDFLELSDRLAAQWREGGDHPIVLSSQVLLARNLTEPYLSSLDGDERLLLRERLLDLLGDCGSCDAATLLRHEDLSERQRGFLGDACRVGLPEPGEIDSSAFLYLQDPRDFLVLGITDHLGIVSCRNGFDLDGAWSHSDRLDTELEDHLDYAFSEVFGYLSPDPRRAGNGLELSCLLHLPALAMGDELSRIFRGLSILGLTVSLPDNWRAPELDSYFKLSTIRSLGRTEQDSLEAFADTISKLDDFEAKARYHLVSEARPLLEDRIWSAFGTLKYCRSVDDKRGKELIGILRLGVLTEILQSMTLQELDVLQQSITDGWLRRSSDRELSCESCEQMRAELLRTWLAER